MIFVSPCMRRKAIALVASCLLPFNSLAATDPVQLRAIVDATIHPLMAEHGLPGMAVAVTVDGKPHFFNYGVAARDTKVPVSEATLFEIGSISKVFTATLALYAQANGKLSLSDPAGKYMPQLKGSAMGKASLLHLGTYTAAGLPMQFPEHVTDERMVRFFQQWVPPAAPGTQRVYSNPSLGLFGHLTALALKRDFADAMEKDLLPQLGLKHSYIRVPPSAMANYAWGHGDDDKPRRMNPDIFWSEAYGIRTSSADMISFIQSNMAPERLTSALRRAVEGTQVGYFKVGNMVQGLGWEQYPFPLSEEQLQAGNSRKMSQQANPASQIDVPRAPAGPTLFNKTGSTGGFSNYVAFVPKHKIGIVLLANRSYSIEARIKAGHAILAQLASAKP